MPSLRTRALILRHIPEREHDQMIVALTPEHGQLRLRARGTKKSVSKLSGSLEPLMEVDLLLADGRTIDLVIGSVILNRFPELRRELVTMAAGQWLLDLLERVTKPNQSLPALYDFSVGALQMLGRAPQPAGLTWLALLRSAWIILQLEGFMPNLQTCAVCGQTIPVSESAFMPGRGFVHSSEADSTATCMSAESIQFVQTGHPPDDRRASLKQIKSIVESILAHTLDQPLRSDAVFQRVLRLEQLSQIDSRSTIRP